MRHRAPQRSPEGAGPDPCPPPAARAGAPQLLQNPFEPQSAGPWQLPPVAMLNYRSSDLGMPVVSQHISGLVLRIPCDRSRPARGGYKRHVGVREVMNGIMDVGG